MELVGKESRKGKSSTSGKEWCLDGKLNLLMLHPEEKLNEYVVCSERKGGEWHEFRCICATWDRKPALHLGECFRKFHAVVHYRPYTVLVLFVLYVCIFVQ
jgi:hypothetical protein